MGSFLRGVLLGVLATASLMGVALYALRGVLPMILPGPLPDIPEDRPSEATESTKALREKILSELPFSQRQDFEFAQRNFIASLEDPKITGANGELVFDLDSYSFLGKDAPDTVNPSLWRQAQLITRHGLFQVHDRIYQVRGFDVSNATFILTDAGYVVVDPLTTAETARAALGLVRKHVGDRPVVAVIYSHSHVDHFGGVTGVTSEEEVRAGRVRIIAPETFLEHAVSENILVGVAMARRARFQFGTTLPRSPEGELTSGLGPGIPRGSITLIAPTETISKTGQELQIGGVTFSFQVTPGTEAPAEMNFYLPQFRVLFMAENANATMHNLLPARGSLVRDAKAWADYLTESIRLFADRSDVVFAAHGIPRWGTDVLKDFLVKQRDAYKFLHDQTVRLMNAGLTGTEIAENLRLPDPLAREWFNRGYYGTMSHNSKAVYQRYMGWYDANPASLEPLPPVAAATHYVEAIGGAQAVLSRAQSAVRAGEYRWASMLLNHLVFADPDNRAARELLADVYTQLGYRTEAGTWRNIYLTGAQELRHGVLALPLQRLSMDLVRATPTSMMLDFAAVRLNPERAAGKRIVLNIRLSDTNERHLITVQNSVLVHEKDVTDDTADATVTMERNDLLQTLLAGVPVGLKTATGAIRREGSTDAYAKLVELIDPLDPNFPIVTP
ncbi:MAG: MBL fold metallo-hydrolase [Myxococcales bacterium]|nr:MBL fold metallo-hydrolase [Myxococcales bacterium]